MNNCGVTANISNGNINLDIENITTFNATATVIYCGEVPHINFGNVTQNDESNSTYGSIATVTCLNGYIPLNSTVQCEESGTWGIASCIGKDCGSVLNITYGVISLDDPNNSTYGSTASLHCDIGYMTDTDRIYCLQTGEWEIASCFLIDCGTPESLSNDDSCKACLPVIIAMALVVAITLLSFGSFSIYMRIRYRKQPLAEKNVEDGNDKSLEDEIKEHKRKTKERRLHKNK
ncbi:calcium ion binding [Mactra antiquata]